MKRAGERREDEKRHEKIFSDQARAPSGQADVVETLRAELKAARETAATEVETLRAELKAAREEATEAKARGETEMAPGAKADLSKLLKRLMCIRD